MMVKLLNDGGYSELSHLNFPIEVSGEYFSVNGSESLVDVDACELIRVGARWDACDGELSFYVGTECEVIE